MTLPGYFGRCLYVDVSNGEVRRPTLDDGLLRRVIGGVGLGTALLTRHTTARYDPVGERACVVFAFSPLVGTPITTSAKLAVVAKSPLTERLNDALSSSDFAVAGKRSGHDAIVLQGRAAEPSMVLVDDEVVRIITCSELWNTDRCIADVDRTLRERHPGFSFAVIGAAGERGVRYASLTNGLRHAGRGGLGAVLGSMRIKAVGVRGSRRIELAHPQRVVAIARDLAERSLGPATAKYRELGTVANLATFNRLAALPTRNFQASTFEGADNISGEQLHLTRERGRSACRSCTIGCEHFFQTSSGARVKLEYESLFALGSLCGIDDPEVTLRAAERCDELGLDTVSTGGTIAFAIECAERGLFADTPWRAEAHALRFGDGAAVLTLIDDIGLQRTALGRLLGLGTRSAAECIGPPAPDFAPHVKGLELPGYEPRALQTMALGFAVGTRGADHNKSGAYEVDFSSRVDRFAPSTDAAKLAVDTEDRAALIDSLILCKFLRGVFDDLYAESADALAAITGEDISASELRQSAARIVLCKKLFNVREGWTRSEDCLPKRFLTERLPSGVARGVVIDAQRLAALIAAYYQARGFDEDGSVPAAEVVRAELTDLFGADAIAAD